MDRFLIEKKETTNYYEFVYKNSMKPDVEIVLKDKILKAHKEVLASRNPVFLDELLSQPDLDKIEIPNLDPEAVEIFISYLYTGKVPEENISDELLLVAHKYVDPNLKNMCRKVLGQNLTLNNATGRFLAFINCKEKKLIKETSLFLAKNFNDVKIYSTFNEVFANEEATDAIFAAFYNCKITILSEDKFADRNKLIESATTSDLVIRVQDHSFLAHKSVLSSRNSVFETIIAALPVTETVASSIDITDFEPSTFKVFLKYIYTRDVNKDEFTKPLINIAHKYVDSNLMKICEVFLVSKVDQSNALDLLLLSLEVGSLMLKKEASKFIAEKYAELKDRVDFQKLSHNPQAVKAIFMQFAVKIHFLNERCIQKNTNLYICETTLKVPDAEGSSILSASFYMRNVPWQIEATLRSPYVGFYLRCNDKNVPFSHKVNYSLTLVSSVDKVHDVLFNNTGGNKIFSSSDTKAWGWKEFVTVTDLNNKEKGLMTNFKVVVKFEVKFVN